VTRVRVALLLLLLVTIVAVAPPVAAGGAATETGTLGGAAYRVDVPESWNGTLLLFSHGYVVPRHGNPAVSAPDRATANYLLSRGYALAGSAYASTGWAVQDALRDQMALLDAVQRRWHPRRVVAWGSSMGGLLTALLVQQHPDRFAGGMPMCGVVGGGSSQWNTWLTSHYAFWRLVANGDPNLRVVHIGNQSANLRLALSYLAAAQKTPAGRARVALAAALGDVPGWIRDAPPTSPQAQEAAQASWERQIGLWFGFAGRAELEARAGGNPSWTRGADYGALLDRSVAAPEVRGLYGQAGLDVGADLSRLASGPQVAADPAAAGWLSRFGTPSGALRRPLLTLHTVGDGLVPVANEQALAASVSAAGAGGLLRQAFVGRAGHCAFTPGEAVASLQALVARLDSGGWPDVSARRLASDASALGAPGSSLNRSAPAFTGYRAPPALRPERWPPG
jgi:dienelactone hydrolase